MATHATDSEDQTMDKLDQPAHAARRRLPMVEVDNYTFTGPQGPVTLTELFPGPLPAHGAERRVRSEP